MKITFAHEIMTACALLCLTACGVPADNGNASHIGDDTLGHSGDTSDGDTTRHVDHGPDGATGREIDGSSDDGPGEDSETGNPWLPTGTVVARIEASLSDEETFIVHATVPLPPGIYTPTSAMIPLVVLNPDGSAAPTQVDGVSRFADDERDGFDVVQVTARVRRPDEGATGDRVTYDVQYAPHDPSDFLATDSTQTLLGDAEHLTLWTTDVFGNRYRANLLEGMPESGGLRLIRSGPVVRQWHTHTLLVPVAEKTGPEATLPRLLAVHAFISQYRDEDYVSVDLQVHNAMSGLDTNDPRDDAYKQVYFERLDLRLPSGWSSLRVLADPLMGADRVIDGWAWHPIIEAQPDGTLHVIRSQGQFVRRMVLAPSDQQAPARRVVERGDLAFAVPGNNDDGVMLWSWANPETAAYLPQDLRLPSLDHLDEEALRSGLNDRFATFKDVLATGQPFGDYPLETGNLGYARPWGAPYGGMTGGVGIDLSAGAHTLILRSRAGYRFAELQVRTTLDRQPHGLWDLDGRPTELSDWLREDNGTTYFPGYFNGAPILPHNDPFGFGDAPTFQIDAVVDAGKVPPYEEDLLFYKPIDCQHWTRYTRNLKALVWIGNDALAKNELMMAAALYRLTAHEYPVSKNGQLQGHALSGQQAHVSNLPGQGLGFGRAWGWGLDATAAAYSLGDSGTRTLYYDWFTAVVDLVEQGQSTCGGYLQAQPHHSNGKQYRIRQAYEEAISDNGLRAMNQSVFRGHDAERSDRIDDVLIKRAYGAISPAFWSASGGGQFGTVAVGPHATSEPAYCGDAEDVWASAALEKKYTWNMLMYSYLATEDPEFLDKARDMSGADDLFSHSQELAYDDLANRISFIAGMQALNATP